MSGPRPVGASGAGAPLEGCRVVVTRERPGALADLLDAAGASVVHVPLIVIGEPSDRGESLQRELARLTDYDWLLVTSAAGAERVGDAASATTGTLLAAVGTATAATLADRAGRPVDLVPERHTANDLAAAFVARHRDRPAQRVLLALADRAGSDLADTLAHHGHAVTRVTAYRTRLRTPSAAERQALHDSDAVLFASGSAAEAWRAALGPAADELLPRHVIAIGPTTSAAARKSGLKVTAVATDQTLTGLVDALVASWSSSSAL